MSAADLDPLAWWRDRLAGAPTVLDLPADGPRPARLDGRRTVTRRIGGAWAADLRQLAEREAVPIDAVLLAGFAALLARYSGQEELLIGVPAGGTGGAVSVPGAAGAVEPRAVGTGEAAVAPAMGAVAVRLQVRGEADFRALVAAAGRELAAVAGRSAPSPATLAAALGADRDPSRHPLFQVMVSVAVDPPPAILPAPPDGLDLVLAVTLGGAAAAPGSPMALTLDHAADLWSVPAAERLLDQLVTLLASASAPAANLGVAAADGVAGSSGVALRRVADLALLGEGERHQLLREWSGGERHMGGADAVATVPGAAAATVPDLFAAAVARTPAAVAVSCGDASLSYGELDRRASRLARHLRALGVGPEVPVALCLERGLDLIVAVVGILKAGGGYVPLDPSYPEERLRFIVGDALAGVASPVLVTREDIAPRFVSPRRAAADGPAGDAALNAAAAAAPGAAASTVDFRFVLVDRDGGRIAAESDAALPAGMTAANLAYVIYTSGSTGGRRG
jgi:non-ribosomal peptide synthetase component F